MKNIKILTFHNAENYGAMLQAYALKETVKKLGHNASLLNYQDKHILKDYKLIKTNTLKSFFSSIWFLKRNLKRKKSFKSFSDKYLDTKSKKYYAVDEINKDINVNDIFIAGSDQIFNPVLTNGLSDVYTLNFNIPNENKLVYGASLGNEETLAKYEKDFKEKLKDIKNISVREQNIINPLEQILDKEITKVLDPTLLLEKKAWESLIEENILKEKITEKYILVYTLFESDEITKAANELSSKTGLKVVHFRKYNAYEKELCSLYKTGPIEFINAFKNAEYIITNSFHGLVFSIIFEKMFNVVLPKERGGRLKDLLTLTCLDNRILKDCSDVTECINNKIDYLKVKELLNTQKEKSIEFLKKGIN